jgi:hypothetical protein
MEALTALPGFASTVVYPAFASTARSSTSFERMLQQEGYEKNFVTPQVFSLSVHNHIDGCSGL